jgi:3,4-dehydroadipyl-CoA semialdehyde dehydrogenase
VEFELFVNEVVREMTVKAGQKCTAIRRAFVPLPAIETAAEVLACKLRKIVVGNPRNASVQMGPLVNRAQLDAARAGLKVLQRETTTVYEPDPGHQLVDADPAVGAFLPPMLLRCDDPDAAKSVHDVEVFGPVATLIPYDTPADALNLIRRGEGSLVASLFSADSKFIDVTATELADSHGRVLAVNASVAKSQTGHGNVMPMCLHGGPGRAGGGEELGGLRSLLFHHRRTALQAPLSVLESVRDQATPFNA